MTVKSMAALRGCILSAVASVAVFAAIAAPAVALPSTNWYEEPSVNGRGSFSHLEGVSCASSISCIGVGVYGPGANAALAENWDGTEWEQQALPSTSTEWSELHAVSCFSATACTAVGRDGYDSLLAERWSGTAWTLQTIPAPTAEVADLDSVSCPSASACMAVGESEYGQFSESWSGSTWTTQPMPSPGSGQKYVLGVSCTAENACTAVGMFYNESAPINPPAWNMFAERWNGTKWTLESIANPNEAKQTRLYGVSCYAANECTAVGSYETPTQYTGLIEYWDGTTWSQQELPAPVEGFGGEDLSAISCLSKTSCTAAGEYVGNAPETEKGTLTDFWNGTEWTRQTTVNSAGSSENRLDSISCFINAAAIEQEECQAVGLSGTSVLAEGLSEEAVHNARAEAQKINQEKRAAEEAKLAEEEALKEQVVELGQSQVAGQAAATTPASATIPAPSAEGPPKPSQATIPASASSLAPAVVSRGTTAKVTTQKLAKALTACKKLRKKQRLACEAQLRRRAKGKRGKK